MRRREDKLTSCPCGTSSLRVVAFGSLELNSQTRKLANSQTRQLANSPTRQLANSSTRQLANSPTLNLSANRYTLNAKLEVNRNGYLQYSWGPKRGQKAVLYGKWLEISDTRLIYKLSGSRDKLEFKVQLQPRQHLKHNRLAYDITAGKRKTKRTSTLFFAGKWLINKKGDKARFRLSIPNTRRKTITFGIDKVLKEGKTLSAVLSRTGSRRKVRLTLRKKDWSIFVEGSKSNRSRGIKGGFRWKF